MVNILLIGILILTLWRLVKIIYNRQYQQLRLAEKLQIYASQMSCFTVIAEKISPQDKLSQQNSLDFYQELGQSIAALHIQLQAAQKLWQVNPKLAEKSLSSAYEVSSTLMSEVRQIVKIMSENSLNN
ncbi:histidine kinase dimerization/phosphoacceptor domain-containing protein [Plectonema cf. radiosum LEGE 06105]|uniref:Histidine kinase dimerization/phosphoacceptor domain-containing protein n=1 Tax=Plectonema cf. radiosum LEGE 06105 TaxID=945769 RepID=A0A8J7F3F3_9CYAN|nr:histidine kinase dimerization/phosphoacceptor domain-containing protein [Plectonema radiosum]MBE9215541.1 histidine kinase dimerization/phosphoacceptor domain-containing protein [Plectonema cf. radiosum LEGE 06105]